MIAYERGRKMAVEFGLEQPADLKPILTKLEIEVVPWRFNGRVREVVLEGYIGIDDRLSEAWSRWLTAHAIGHHLLHTGASFYLESWQWVNRVKAERQAEEFAAGLLAPFDTGWPTTAKRLARRTRIPESKAEYLLDLISRA